MSLLQFETAIIGAGIVGTCIAESLQSQGVNVTLIDENTPGSGCSQGNAGHFATDIILPLANLKTIISVPKLLMDPLGPLSISWRYFPKLIPWLTRFTWAAMPQHTNKTIESLKRLNRSCINDYQDLLARNNLQYMMVQQGALTVYQSQKNKNNLVKHQKLVKAHGVNVELFGAEQIKDLEPEVNNSVLGGLYYPDTAHCIDPYQLTHQLAQQLFEHGTQFYQAKVHSITPTERQTFLIKTSNGNAEANKVVIAAGAFSKSLVEPLGYKLPLETERGYHLMLPRMLKKLQRPITSYERSFVMTPMQSGLRLAGTVELAGLDAPPNYQRAQILAQHAQSLLETDLNTEEVSCWMGHRPSFPDSLPVIDQCKRNKNLYFAFGHQHLGLTQAATTAKIVSEIIRKPFKFNQQHNNPFSIDRF